jgi:cobalt transporter subunit CbtA
MFQKMLTSALGAGCAAWLLAAVLHFAFVQEYILLGETYETGAAVHFAGAVPQSTDADHTHDEGDATASHGAADEAGHDQHSHGGGASEASRDVWTVVFFGLVYVAYAMMLVAGFGLARVYGIVITEREGLLWGIAGFAAFQLAPAMGLAPELPGTMAADLAARQLWWWGTVAATATGLGLLAYGQGLAATALAVVLLAAPHVIGAPEIEGFSGVAPPEVSAAFAARVLGVALTVWALLGWVAGYLWSRETAR